MMRTTIGSRENSSVAMHLCGGRKIVVKEEKGEEEEDEEEEEA